MTIALPWKEGFQVHVYEETDALPLHPGMALPFTEKVIFPGVLINAVSSKGDLKVAVEVFPATDKETTATFDAVVRLRR